nr:unnamed protein product [Spirometra erinaceieuropaei]
MQRLAEHLRSVLKRLSTISDATIALLPQLETNADLELLPRLHETIKVMQQLSSGKVPGSVEIPVEIHSAVGPNS